MRIALLYPPPWKIPARGEPYDMRGDGPPAEYREGDLDADFYQIPYGLLSIAAQALRAGHQVKILNLSAMTWATVEEVLSTLDADLYAMSCWTANRRGVALVAKAIRARRPKAPIVVGGPHASPFAKEILEHWPEVDVATIGESEITFLEIVDRLSAGRSLRGLAGAAYRFEGRVEMGPSRASIEDLDTLASPHAFFDTHILMTSRGCPWACTFCGAENTWGRGFRGQSVSHVLDVLETTVARLPVKMILVKDDTFTTNRKRVLDLCRGIRERNLRFLWSCDTRVDVLGEELLYEMRLAGCERLSLGVESGSPKILKAVDKKITVQKIIDSTELAKKYGIKVRYFMMLGNRGETAETFRETLAFLDRARPHQYIFSCLSIYPGTHDYDEATATGWLDPEVYFTGDFQELKVPFDASEEDTKLMSDWFRENSGLREHFRESAAECEAILARLGDHHAAHLDCASAHYRENNLDAAERHAARALELGHPLPGLCLNMLAVIAARRSAWKNMQDLFTEAWRKDPQHWVLVRNVQKVKAWLDQAGPLRGLPLELEAHNEFQLLERTVQPMLPGPLPPDYAVWSAPAPRAQNPEMRVPQTGSHASFQPKTRLRVVT
ncbi:B12-binding domain-containing radical SAM protein [Polyangium mundeleinium]|uniref:Radical SAM protein n=1 Tax=Polyangium mundeleinium TaxID=2995306 RepID=A0ABT5EMK4_9BACT|nr:radical SAM protein [Polyangium mundeleinium]MDC0741970.1 radical SAM protein [Polyangium mundeleinium]